MRTDRVTDICFIAPTENLAAKTKRIIEERKEMIDVYISALDEAKQLGRQLLERGARILISRKGTKAAIESSCDIKVVGINTILSDYIEIINIARKIEGIIGFFSYEPITDDVRTMCKLLDLDAKYYRFSSNKDCEKCVIDAIKDGVKLGIGGAITGQYAARYGLEHIVVENSEASIINSIETAKQLLNVMNEDLKKQEELRIKLARYEKILDFTNDGIIAVNKKGIITVCNNRAEEIIKKNATELIGKNADAVLENNGITDVLKSGQRQLNRLVSMNSVLISQNSVPIIIDNEIKGVVATFQDIKTLQDSEIQIRKKLHKKGLVAGYRINDILGNSSEISNIRNMAKSYARVNSTVLIEGETGTGKELLAQSIHNLSDRCRKPFVAVNCATLPKELFASELFGYVDGAFTGAIKGGKEGLFEIAHGGTIFLDEIAEIPIEIQGQLLRVLEERKIRRIGSHSLTPVDVRVIVATNKPLEDEVSAKRFREDLYYRLNVLKIVIPPLRERRSDIEIIALELFKSYSKGKYSKYRDFFCDLLSNINDYDWPGNVRELRNFVERVSALIDYNCNTKEIITIINQMYNKKRQWNEKNEIAPDLQGWEYKTIIDALKRNNLVVTKTAKELGISRSTLIRRIKKYDIKT